LRQRQFVSVDRPPELVSNRELLETEPGDVNAFQR
jgi:hypothetical protein